MQRLPNKELTYEQIIHLLNYYKISKGAEAVVCEGPTDYSVYKIFVENFDVAEMPDNKEKKVNLIYQADLDFSTKILSTISCNGKLVGYEMSSKPFLMSYKIETLLFDNEELLHYFKQTKKILEYFKSKGIIYGDFDPRNILIDRRTGEIMFCDMDNIEIEGCPMDIIPWDLYDYKENRGIDFGVHPYMHNIILLKTLSEDIYTINPFTRKRLFHRPSKAIIESMKDVESFNDKYLIDYVKKLSR